MGVVLDRVLSGLTSGADLSEALVPDVDRTKSCLELCIVLPSRSSLTPMHLEEKV